jgi:phage-related protein
MATFTWLPSYGATAQRQPRVKTVRFGDGYQQRFADGLNATAEVWSLQFSSRDTAEASAIDAFLKARAGTENFDWTPPGGSAGKYVCKSWERTVAQSNYESISATFEQVFEA